MNLRTSRRELKSGAFRELIAMAIVAEKIKIMPYMVAVFAHTTNVVSVPNTVILNEAQAQ